jgi:hypothetical protein
MENKAISPITAQIKYPFDSLFGCLLKIKNERCNIRESSIEQ